MAVRNEILSVAEFARLPRPSRGVRQELHNGQVVEMPPVKKRHTELQRRLVRLLSDVVIRGRYGVDKEFPFRPAAEYEVWVADVAVFSLPLWEATPDDDYFQGVPEIVIEVLPPSNSASEMKEREEVCLRHGGQEFWLVDPDGESVKVIRASGDLSMHESASVLESSALSGPISVEEIFSV